jgi:hypothetical protein
MNAEAPSFRSPVWRCIVRRAPKRSTARRQSQSARGGSACWPRRLDRVPASDLIAKVTGQDEAVRRADVFDELAKPFGMRRGVTTRIRRPRHR